MAFLINLTYNWPQLTPAWPFTSAEHYTLVRSSTKFGSHRANSSASCPWFTPSWPLYDFWPEQCIILWSGVLPTKFGDHMAFLMQVDLFWDNLWPLVGSLQKYALGPQGPVSYHMSSFSSIPQRTTKRIAIYTYGVHYFSSINFMDQNMKKYDFYTFLL